ncbi:HNH endonuclease family protein [Arthrobacter crystallopoietes]|uniref:HNH endonuclease family protein n=1 Tax=Crystallibacter crystallopoietes TaxID=37928 RepID=UPI001F21D6BA|nr:HNH endonuclease family protein [Arthrobacter crystallopoietes]
MRPRRRFIAAGFLIVVLLVFWLIAGTSADAEESRGQSSPAPSQTPAAAVPTPPSLVEPSATGNPAPAKAPAPVDPSPEPESAEPLDRQEPDVAALALLETLPIKGRAPKTGYDRDEFGQAWADVDRNGCDTRNDILARDVDSPTFRSNESCRVISGVLQDPYSGRTVEFTRGQETSALVPVDHVVALSDAWQKGAQQLTLEQRTLLANDPLNLLATTQRMNSQKSDGDGATWLPQNKSFRCAYVSRQISVKAAYSLWVTLAEHDAMERILADCPDEAAAGSTLVEEPLAEAEAPAATAPAAKAPAAKAPTGTPAPEADNAPAGAGPQPAPARSVNCSDFGTHAEAQTWFEYYHPTMGDIGGLDADGDLLACVSLP